MRMWRYDRFGPLKEVMSFGDYPGPLPPPGEVVVTISHVALEPFDWKIIDGQYRRFLKTQPPCGIGINFSGHIKDLADDVTGPARGTPVIGYINPRKAYPGTFQEYVAVPAEQVVPVAQSIDLSEACTLPVAGVSALQLCRLAKVKAKHHVLIHGAAGGVGSFAVQIAKLLGARVSATGRTESQAFLATLQPDHLIDYTRSAPASWGGPFNAIIDCASTLGARDVRRLLAPCAAYVNTLPSFPAAIFDPVLNLFRLRRRRSLMLRHNRKDMMQLLSWIEEGRLKPRVTSCLPLDRALFGLTQLAGGHTQGKIVLSVKD